ncbi:LacI family DNA-binding transcriptional regulator [Clostridium sp. 19966]|uniref:substrate-binding domain-containing protein n=1 Tax=Clostridium sp. 19966 TaxID=2768166 RepID=UPI0028DD6B2E|nr:substrate-binding domain-containing protein [Clostridium sp. 19966]MDT8719077.1 LacI family DNA-binding transcriptional regulator [Clostridium sp. 19966]
MTKRVTMQDVADRLGVSKVTVSKALAGKDDISEAMIKKITEVANEIGYLYNSKGRMLKENLTYSIGIITSERYFGQDDFFYVDLYKLLSEKLEASDYTAMLHILNSEGEINNVIPRMLLEQKVDGVIILGQLQKEYLKKIISYNFPMIFLDFYYDKFDVDSILTDNFFGAYEITNYLIEKGHKKIAYVGNVNLTSSIQDRFLGYYKSILEYNLELKDEWIIKDRDDDSNWLEIELPKDLPTAFLCNCDKTALNLIETLKSLGYRVPEDFSVVGFDDSEHAILSDPQITTVKVDIEEMARTAVKIICKEIKNKEKKYGRVLIKGNVTKRNSVKSMYR